MKSVIAKVLGASCVAVLASVSLVLPVAAEEASHSAGGIDSDPLQIVDIDDLPSDGHFASAPASEKVEAPRVQGNFDLVARITAGNCEYDQHVDYAHISGSTVSTPGWWVVEGGACPSRANVDTYLQAYWCDSISGCRWTTVASDSRDLYQGGGSGRRGNARKECATFNSAGWRSFVDVDLEGISDPGGYKYSAPQDLLCTPT